MNIAVFEAGGSKTEVISGTRENPKRLHSAGIHPVFMDSAQIEKVLKELGREMAGQFPHEVFYYGASCGSHEMSWKVEEQLKKVFPDAMIRVDSDLLGTARALCGDNPGFAAILGTGSNACIFDGQSIGSRMLSFGFWLGDEGSGAYLGKKVFREWLKGKIPAEFKKEAEMIFGASPRNALRIIHEEPSPNARMAKLGGLAIKNKTNLVFQRLISDSLEDFFYENESLIRESSHLPFHFSGSVAYHLRDEITEILTKKELNPGIFTDRTTEKLFEYHISKNS